MPIEPWEPCRGQKIETHETGITPKPSQATVADMQLIKAQRLQVENFVIPALEAQINDLQAIAELGELDIFVFLETTTKYYQAKKKLLELYLCSLQAANEVHRLLGPHVQQKPSSAGGSQ